MPSRCSSSKIGNESSMNVGPCFIGRVALDHVCLSVTSGLSFCSIAFSECWRHRMETQCFIEITTKREL